MAKRSPIDESPVPAYPKRQKIQHGSTTVEEIHSRRQLQQLLAFDQDSGRAKYGIQSFKAFLDGMPEDDSSDRISILKEFLQSQTSRENDDEEAVYLSPIIQTWSFASQSNNDSLLSSVPAVLALLLKTLSGKLDLLEYGLRLGRTLLQKRQLELFARCMTANKSKDFIISPCLRLLREMTIFDGGSLARQVFRARDSTLKGLGRNLGLRYVGDGIEDRRKPSVRTNAVRYFLACLKFFPVDGKRELLNQRDMLSGLTREISHDPPSLVADILETAKLHILQEEKLPRDAKSKFLNSTHLGRLVLLYGHDQRDDQVEGSKPVDVLAHDFLKLACTTPDIGVLRRQTGFYPPGVNANGGDLITKKRVIDLGLESIEWANSFTEKVPVRNTTLSELIQALRPWSNMMQSELLLAIFEAAPELVADYFFTKKNFSFEPKLTATWIGYSATVFSTVQLPVPKYFGLQHGYGRLPPPVSIIIENIIPRPVTQKILSRCLNQQSELITFYAMRLLITAFTKLQDVLVCCTEAATENPGVWEEAATNIVLEFCQRCPPIKDAIHAYLGTHDTNLVQLQAGSNLLVKYYEVVPQIAFESKFDVSVPLAKALKRLNGNESKSEDKALLITEVENILQIARCSSGMRWFNKVDLLSMSPFTSMIRLLAESSTDVPKLNVRVILDSIVKESGILQNETSLSSVDALIAALNVSSRGSEFDKVLEFVDDCVLRCSTTPIKYIDILEKELGYDHLSGTSKLVLSLLLITIVDQWQFLVKSSEPAILEPVAQFIANFIAASLKIQEDEKAIKSIIKRLAKEAPSKTIRKLIEHSQKLIDNLDVPLRPMPLELKCGTGKEEHDEKVQDALARESFTSFGLPATSEDTTALHRWASKDLATVVEDQHASAVVNLLSSPHLSIRKEAHTNLAKLAHALQTNGSSLPSKSQLWLLLSELLESTRQHVTSSPVPSTITAFATHAIVILQNPLHTVYPKLNTFLCRGPSWDLGKIPLLNNILNEPPTVDDTRYQEFDFLLSYLVDAVKTEDDLAIFYKKRVVEKLLVQYANPYLGQGMKERILGILWRVAAVPGGSTTLVTRCGVLSWLTTQMSISQGPLITAKLQVLGAKILETCDVQRVETWAHCKVQDLTLEMESQIRKS